MRLGRHARRRWPVRIALASAAAATVVIAAACSAAPPATTAASSPAPVVAATSAPGVTLTPGPTTTRASARSASPTRARPTRTSQPPTPSAPSSPAPSATGTARLVTFRNNVDQTIWVAASPDATAPLAATGWVLPAGQSVTITVPNNWNGRFWGRTGCVFNSQGTGHCETGDCGGKFQCTGWGTIPATLAEYDMDAWDGMDFYDVSMVDGSNLPMYINIAVGGTPDKISPEGCVPAGCTTPVDCPSALQVTVDGSVVACESACARFGTDQYCCRGQWASRAACNPAQWPVDYAAVFKKAEPYAYSYVDDDATSVFTCSGGCDYRITFGVTP
jgi:Thaumatin family